MTDKEIQHTILQHAYDHQHEHVLRLVEVAKIETLKNVEETRLRHNLIYLQKEGLIEHNDDAYTILRLSNDGINLVDHKERFDAEFPIKTNVPEETKKMILSVEGLLLGKYDSVLEQFQKGIKFLYHNTTPDALNSVKETVGAVEGLAKILLKQPSSTLGDLAKPLASNYMNHPAMEKIIHGIYGVASDVPGARHGAHRQTDFGFSDAEFILNVSASIILYLMKGK